jgi:hypothetical protein
MVHEIFHITADSHVSRMRRLGVTQADGESNLHVFGDFESSFYLSFDVDLALLASNKLAPVLKSVTAPSSLFTELEVIRKGGFCDSFQGVWKQEDPYRFGLGTTTTERGPRGLVNRGRFSNVDAETFPNNEH